MTEAFRVEESLAVSNDQAWAALTDLGNGPAWMPGVDSMSVSGELRPGSVVTFRSRGKDHTSTVSALEPGSALTLRSVQGPVTADYVYRIESTADATTRVTLHVDVSTSRAMRLLGPVIRSAIAKADRSQLTCFKSFVENGVDRGAQPPSPNAL